MVDLVVRKVGEGLEKPQGEQELPIDVNYHNVIEFLVSYRLAYDLAVLAFSFQLIKGSHVMHASDTH
jgi:hypothetical protein